MDFSIHRMLIAVYQLLGSLAVYKNLGVKICLYAALSLTELGLFSHSKAGVRLRNINATWLLSV